MRGERDFCFEMHHEKFTILPSFHSSCRNDFRFWTRFANLWTVLIYNSNLWILLELYVASDPNYDNRYLYKKEMRGGH